MCSLSTSTSSSLSSSSSRCIVGVVVVVAVAAVVAALAVITVVGFSFRDSFVLLSVSFGRSRSLVRHAMFILCWRSHPSSPLFSLRPLIFFFICALGVIRS